MEFELEQKPNNSMPQQVYENKINLVNIYEHVKNMLDLISSTKIKEIKIEEVE